jgi:hypothetical protein
MEQRRPDRSRKGLNAKHAWTKVSVLAAYSFRECISMREPRRKIVTHEQTTPCRIQAQSARTE